MFSVASLRWLLISALVIIADQYSKYAVIAEFTLGDSKAITPFFDLVLVLNHGAAFSFLADGSGWRRWFFIALALLISFFMSIQIRRFPEARLDNLAYSLVIGGAIGNVMDRLNFGAVVDFLYFHVAGYGWPAFNVADSAICIGVGLMIWSQLKVESKKRQAKQADSSSPSA